MEVKATLVEGIGKKSGKPYTALEIQLTDTFKKMVFLEPAELELLKLTKVQSNTQDLDEKPDTGFWN